MAQHSDDFESTVRFFSGHRAKTGKDGQRSWPVESSWSAKRHSFLDVTGIGRCLWYHLLSQMWIVTFRCWACLGIIPGFPTRLWSLVSICKSACRLIMVDHADFAVQLLLVWYACLLLNIFGDIFRHNNGALAWVELHVSIASGTAAKATVELE